MSYKACFRFYEELNDFLTGSLRKKDIPFGFEVSPSVKDAIESLGAPHTEVDLILANGNSVDFFYRLKDGDRISVYPEFETLDITPLIKLRLKPLRITRFVLDVHLGKLARNLRMLGFDCLYQNDIEDSQIVDLAINEKRVVLTRDLGILKHKIITRGYFLRSQDPWEQTKEVIDRLHLSNQLKPFTRCIDCNGQLKPVNKSLIVDQLEPGTRGNFDKFYQCISCGKIYWPGSHYQKMVQRIDALAKASD